MGSEHLRAASPADAGEAGTLNPTGVQATSVSELHFRDTMWQVPSFRFQHLHAKNFKRILDLT